MSNRHGGHDSSQDLEHEGLLQVLLNQIDPSLARLTRRQLEELLAKAGLGPGAQSPPAKRWQDAIIEQEIPEGASVLDLGCGGGQLLQRLIKYRNVRGQGVELDASAVMSCVERGVPVFQADLDEGLRGFPSRSFDYVVLEETLQTLRQPAQILREMLRVGRHGIVSFPNFGHWRIRLDLAARGRVPTGRDGDYEWFNTPNIRPLTLEDFRVWLGHNGAQIADGQVLVEGTVRRLEPADNLYAQEVLLIVEAK